MQRKDHISDDVIRIFHNAKGSVKNNLEKWVDNTDAQVANSEEPINMGGIQTHSATMQQVNMNRYRKKIHILLAPKRNKKDSVPDNVIDSQIDKEIAS